MSELIFLGMLAVLGVVCLGETMTYTVAPYDRTGGPAVYPQIVLVLLFVALALRAVQLLTSKTREKFKWTTLFQAPRGVFFAAFLLFVVLMKPLGFIVDSTLFLTFTSLFLYYKTTDDKSLGGAKTIILRFIISAAFSSGVYLFFAKVLHVAVPEGILSAIL